jgi:diguanylate cyclase (GGDEF)-like protein
MHVNWLGRLLGRREPSSQPPASYGSGATSSSVGSLRSTFIQLQALIAVVLSTQLLFAADSQLSHEARLTTILGLLGFCGLLMVLPNRWINADWFPGAVAVIDTIVTSGLIYLSGNAGSDLYLAYFVVILIVTTSRSPIQMTLFLTLVTAIYGWTLYREIDAAGVLTERHLLRIPLLLIMAVFYRRMAVSVQLLTHYDPVTGLPNRRHLLRLLARGVAAGRAPVPKALLYLGLDGFKRVNETLGQALADQLLVVLADRIKQGLRTTDVVARVGADEFSVLLHNVKTPEVAGRLAQRLLRALQAPLNLSGQEIFIGANIGIALDETGKDDASNLIVNADAAMSRAKERGKNSYEFYSPEMNAHTHERLVLESRLHRAIERQEIQVYYQPQFHLVSRRIVGLEALARWNDPESGLISPAKFIPLAEDTGLIVPIGEAVLRQACRQLKQWQEAGRLEIPIAVNLSAVQFRQPRLADTITAILAESDLAPDLLELELTESCVMHDAESALKTLTALKAKGIRISIDDFGTGYSSLIYLRRLPIDALKIDRAFTQDMVTSADAQAIIAAIIAMAESLKLTVIAEGVETEEQMAHLVKQRCYYAQGFAFSKPLPAAEVTRLLERQDGWGQSGASAQAVA